MFPGPLTPSAKTSPTSASGDLVFGVPDYMGYPTAGASDYAVLAFWAPIPDGLDPIEAASLPMAVETAVRALDLLGAVERPDHRDQRRVGRWWASPPSRLR